jgi:hypothetical protein
MESRRVYVAMPGQVPGSAFAIRDDNARGTVTVECSGAATDLPITRGVASLVIGNRGRAPLSLLGDTLPHLEACKKKCAHVLGPEYFTEADGVFLPPRDEVFEMALRVFAAATDRATSRSSIILERPPSAGPVERPPSAGPVERPPSAGPVERPPSAGPVERPRRPSTSSSFAETHAAERAVTELEKRLEKLGQDKARAEKNTNRVLRARFLKKVEAQIAAVSAELEAARRAV